MCVCVFLVPGPCRWTLRRLCPCRWLRPTTVGSRASTRRAPCAPTSSCPALWWRYQQTHAHTLTQSLPSTLWPSPSFLPPGERDGGAVCEEGSVQSPPGDDRLAVWPQLVLRQVQHHAGTTVGNDRCCCGWLNITLWPEQRSHMKSIFSFISLFHLFIFIYQSTHRKSR